MNPKFKALLAILAGVLSGGIVIVLIEMLSPHTPPPGTNVNDPDQMQAWISTMPLEAFIVLLLAYFLGAAAGGYVANRIAVKTPYRPALIVGAGLFVAGLMNLMAISHPLWFALLSSLMYFVGAWIGGRVANRAKQAIKST